MTAEPEPPPSSPDSPEEPTPPTEQPDEPEQPPLSAVAERFRIPLGAIVALLGAVLAVTFAVRPLELVVGTRGVVEHIAAIAIWVFVAAVGVSWAVRAPRKVSNLLAVGGIAAYVVMLVAGL